MSVHSVAATVIATSHWRPLVNGRVWTLAARCAMLVASHSHPQLFPSLHQCSSASLRIRHLLPFPPHTPPVIAFIHLYLPFTLYPSPSWNSSLYSNSNPSFLCSLPSLPPFFFYLNLTVNFHLIPPLIHAFCSSLCPSHVPSFWFSFD